MGMGVFTGKFSDWNITFSLYAFLFCNIGRFCNIFPLSCLSNLRRTKRSSRITCKMQSMLWFAGLRGAIAYALAENMPGENRTTYIQATLSICAITTIICGGFTEKMLNVTGMKEGQSVIDEDEGEDGESDRLIIFSSSSQEMEMMYEGLRSRFVQFDENFLMVYFGGAKRVIRGRGGEDEHGENLGNYELGKMNDDDDDS